MDTLLLYQSSKHYLSFPKTHHVEAALGGDWSWTKDYRHRGHWEYVENVERTVNYVRALGITVDDALKTAAVIHMDGPVLLRG